jgi:hypothetical protein
VNLKEKEDEEVIDFFDLEPDDLNPPEHEQ